MFNFKITKTQQILRVQNDMVGIQYWYAVYLNIDVPDKPGYIWRRRFVTYFGVDDVMEYFGTDDAVTDKQIKEAREAFITSHAESICNGSNIAEITKACNDTIDRYNNNR